MSALSFTAVRAIDPRCRNTKVAIALNGSSGTRAESSATSDWSAAEG
jgi:hypothetical protein